MPLHNTDSEYGTAAKALHWTIALLVIGLLVMGLTMDGLPTGPGKLEVYNLHKSLGVTVLVLMALRLGWRVSQIQPAPMAGHRQWERALARAVHYFLYAALLLMPLSGWMMSSAAGRPVSFFGLFTLPDLVPKDRDLRGFFGEVHEFLGWSIMSALALHVAGALKHHVIDRDGTLRRMLPSFCAKEPSP